MWPARKRDGKTKNLVTPQASQLDCALAAMRAPSYI